MTTLSICIPTLNRLDYLKASLLDLLPQAQRLGVEVCVSDNASSDGTADFLASLAIQHSCLKVRRFEKRLDIDSSMIAAIAMGAGKYIFPLGDDDQLVPGALEVLLARIGDETDDMLVLNGWHTDPLLRKLRPHLDERQAGQVYRRPDEAFAALWDRMPFGAFLARAGLFRQGPGAGSFHGTSHAYTGVVWDALAARFEQTGACTVGCLAEPVVLLRGAEKAWKKEALDILLFQIGDWFARISQRHPVYRQVVTVAAREYVRVHLRFSQLARYRCAGALDRAAFKKLLLTWPDRKAVILATMLLPRWLLQLYLKKRRIDYAITGL